MRSIEYRFWCYLGDTFDLSLTLGMLVGAVFTLVHILVCIILSPVLMWMPRKHSDKPKLHDYISEAIERWSKDVKEVNDD